MNESEPRAVDVTQLAPNPALGKRIAFTAGLPLVVVGAAMCVTGAINNYRVFAFSWLLGFAFYWTIVLGALFFVAMQHVVRAEWSVVVRRVGEMIAWLLPLVAVLFVPVILMSRTIYIWMDPVVRATDHLVQLKSSYLNLPFFIIRTLTYFAIWIGFALFFVKKSSGQDSGIVGPEATLRMRNVAGPFILIFALTMTFASFDWMMSLDPHWFSTIYGVYVFGGMAISAYAVVILGTLFFRRNGMLGNDLIGRPHFYSLGAWLFAWSCFWGYIAMSQYLLIWYGNLPEETIWYVERWNGNWKYMTMLMVNVRFTLPFLGLLSRTAKTDPRILCGMSLCLLVGHFLDLHWLIMPRGLGEGSVFNWIELGPLTLMGGLMMLGIGIFARRHALLAKGDPVLDASLNLNV